MLRQLLEQAGHEVHDAGDGPQGVDAALRLEPDVALIDVGLPELDGYEVARRIRAGTRRDMLLVALTGYGLAEDRERALAAGFDLHLVKPVDFDKLFDVLATVDRPARVKRRASDSLAPGGVLGRRPPQLDLPHDPGATTYCRKAP
jgi:CheY-like chemotaxis protein